MLQMSLHLGNLSARVRQDELDRVFRRFGRCTVQLKDKFGFVVYDFPANAERALRTLRGRNICGERIYISWSNRQPRPLQRSVRGGRSYETPRRRNYGREDYDNRNSGSGGRRDNGLGFKHRDTDSRRFATTDLVDEATSYRQESTKGFVAEKHHKSSEDLPDESRGFEPQLGDDDRWDEQVGDLSNGNEVENGSGFDRYEPYHGTDRRNEDEIHDVTHSGGSPALKKSQERTMVDQIGDATLDHHVSRKAQTCFRCGELGHKMRNCPQEYSSKVRKLSRFDRRQGKENKCTGKNEGHLKSLAFESRERLRSGRDDVPVRKHRSDRKVSSSREHHRLIVSDQSPLAKEAQRSRRKDYREKKRSRRESGSPVRRKTKKSRRSVSSPIHSDYTASRSGSYSKSSKSASRSTLHARMRSASLSLHSLSSRSSSGSASHPSRSRSRSSSSTSLPLSVSLGQHSPSSPNKARLNDNSLLNADRHESEEFLAERGQLVEGDTGCDNSKLQNPSIGIEIESAAVPSKMDKCVDQDHFQGRDDLKHAVSRDSSEVKNSCTLLLERSNLTARTFSHRESRELQNLDVSDGEHMVVPSKKPESEASVKPQAANSTRVTPQEIYMVLKHYGLEHPAETDEELPVEAYFGSARLWPWEVIYYKRLRKGPISTENYARRIAHNREFGIVDKYIRSSSGWDEMGEGDS
ncbi:hypothetical protein RJ640_014122 [Escallonia rubra]|uniref:Serine/arginine-rich splicing factor 4 n=1 Tax=Escallonia rubra TaxID=112253 RepID=A0AA88Q8V1_9ASTE|nr:hypothetical protein RJ640_014122 [Escallonia rubra]